MGMIAFAYYGGKQRHLAEILPLLPAATHFLDVFGGSAAVLLNRAPSPIETFNDLNSDITNFFRALRDNPDELIHALTFTPYSRDEFYQAWEPCENHIERARRFYVRVTMDISKAGAKKDRSFSTCATYDKRNYNSPCWNLISKVAGLPAVVDRLRQVQIENRTAAELIRKYDRPWTLFYCDPPYLPETRTSKNSYVHDMSIEQHRKLAEVLNSVTGRVALSGYDSPTMTELYPPDRWQKHLFKERRLPMSKTGKRRCQEVLWTNYDPSIITGQTSLRL